jgi:hypothetical protein
MRYVCDASANATWFRIETVAEAALESDLMKHAVESIFGRRVTEPFLHMLHPRGSSSNRILASRRTFGE